MSVYIYVFLALENNSFYENCEFQYLDCVYCTVNNLCPICKHDVVKVVKIFLEFNRLETEVFADKYYLTHFTDEKSSLKTSAVYLL